MFTEEICQIILKKGLFIIADCMIDNGICIEKNGHLLEEDEGRLPFFLVFISDDPYCSHIIEFSNLKGISEVLNSIESNLNKWLIYNIDKCRHADDWSIMPLSSYLEMEVKPTYDELLSPLISKDNP